MSVICLHCGCLNAYQLWSKGIYVLDAENVKLSFVRMFVVELFVLIS